MAHTIPEDKQSCHCSGLMHPNLYDVPKGFGAEVFLRVYQHKEGGISSTVINRIILDGLELTHFIAPFFSFLMYFMYFLLHIMV